MANLVCSLWVLFYSLIFIVLLLFPVSSPHRRLIIRSELAAASVDKEIFVQIRLRYIHYTIQYNVTPPRHLRIGALLPLAYVCCSLQIFSRLSVYLQFRLPADTLLFPSSKLLPGNRCLSLRQHQRIKSMLRDETVGNNGQDCVRPHGRCIQPCASASGVGHWSNLSGQSLRRWWLNCLLWDIKQVQFGAVATRLGSCVQIQIKLHLHADDGWTPWLCKVWKRRHLPLFSPPVFRTQSLPHAVLQGITILGGSLNSKRNWTYTW